MHHDPIHPGDAVRRKVDAELEAIEADPAFQRAPVMRRLLRFLVTETLGGRGDKLKSYAIAVEALGREADFDPQTDSSPRVQVARLRKLHRRLEEKWGRERALAFARPAAVRTVPHPAGDPAVLAEVCRLVRERFWDGYGWRVRRVQVCD